MPLFTTYNSTKLKTQLKMAITRLQIFNNKKSALTKQQIREIATLLAETPPKEEKARIKAEALIRDDSTVEACEIIALSCELLSERISLVTHSRDCPPDLISSVSTIIWASAVLDIPELTEIRRQFRLKWGKQFEMDAMQNVGGVINERVAAKLSVQPPSAYLVQLYLERIADQHQVNWKAKQPLTAQSMAEPTVPPDGRTVPMGGASGLNPGEYHVAFLPEKTSVGAFAAGTVPSHGQYASAPPFSPSYAVPPVAPTTTTQSPYAPGVTVKPSSPSALDADDQEEVDIYVPALSQSRRANDAGTVNQTMASRGRTQSAGEASNGFDASAHGGEGTAGTVEESYAELAARFAKLKQ